MNQWNPTSRFWMLILIGALPERLVHGHQSRLLFPTSLAPPGPAIGFSTATLIQGRIRLNQLLKNVRVNGNTKFKRLELLPFETVFQIQSKKPTSPAENGHCSTPPPSPPPPLCRLPFAWPCWEWVPYPLGNFGQAFSVFKHDMKIWFWQERAVITLGLHSFRWLKVDWTDLSRRVDTGS